MQNGTDTRGRLSRRAAVVPRKAFGGRAVCRSGSHGRPKLAKKKAIYTQSRKQTKGLLVGRDRVHPSVCLSACQSVCLSVYRGFHLRCRVGRVDGAELDVGVDDGSIAGRGISGREEKRNKKKK